MISWVEKEHETMSDKEFFKQVMPEQKQLSETEEVANTDCFNKHSC